MHKNLPRLLSGTPALGERGGDPCESHHVMAKMTAGIVELKLKEKKL